MRTIASCVAILFTGLAAHAQVMTVFEIDDPGARVLQQRYLNELNAIGDEIQNHQFPYPFYLSRVLDIDEKRQQKVDQRSLRFDKFNGRTVLEITGNYYAAYSGELMDKRARAKKTYEEVVLPILKSAVAKIPPDDTFAAFAVEVSYHVRRHVMKVETENPENVTFVVPRATAHQLITAANEDQQQAALLDSEVYLDAEPFLLWLTGEPPEDVVNKKAHKAKTMQAADNGAAQLITTTTPENTVAQSLVRGSLPVRLITPATLTELKSAHADTIERMVRNLDSQAHFVAYAAPSFIAFHEGAYLQISVNSPITTNKGSRYQFAALAFDDHISHLIRPVLAYFPQSRDFDGISFSTTVKLPDGNNSEAVEFFFPFNSLRCFANYDCTGQQIIDSGIVLINGERAALNLQRAEAELR
jgi:hypothetical protein